MNVSNEKVFSPYLVEGCWWCLLTFKPLPHLASLHTPSMRLGDGFCIKFFTKLLRLSIQTLPM